MTENAAAQLAVTTVGGPTVVIDLGGLRFVTDPTFDTAGSSYELGQVSLHKRTRWAVWRIALTSCPRFIRELRPTWPAPTTALPATAARKPGPPCSAARTRW